jgi:hypothetical protein
MPKWKKDQIEFPVTVSSHETRGFQAYIPKPLMEILGNPKSIKFVIHGKEIHVEPHK